MVDKVYVRPHVRKKPTKRQNYHTYTIMEGKKLKVSKLSESTKKHLLRALDKAIDVHEKAWTAKQYKLLKKAIEDGYVIENPNTLGTLIGTPVLKTGEVGYEYTLNLYLPEERLVIIIPKYKMYSPEIGFSAYRV